MSVDTAAGVRLKVVTDKIYLPKHFALIMIRHWKEIEKSEEIIRRSGLGNITELSGLNFPFCEAVRHD